MSTQMTKGQGTLVGAPDHPRGRSAAWDLAGSLLARLGIARFSGVYGLIVLIVYFSMTIPSLFFTEVTFKLVLRDQAVTGLLALGSLVPLAAGVIDLSFAWVAGFGVVMFSQLTLHTSWSAWLCSLITILACAGFGAFSGIVVTLFQLDSLIVTLGTGTLALGLTELLTGGGVITPRLDSLGNLGQGFVGLLPIPVLVLAGAAVIEYVWLEHSTAGRRLLASGDNPAAAVLAGIKVAAIQRGALVFSGAVAGVAGIVLVAEVGSATNTTGSSYLLPAIAALFLGTTQVLPRVNVIGTVIAVYMLGVGIKGLQLHGAQPWVQDFFNGAVLLLAVVIAARGARRRG